MYRGVHARGDRLPNGNLGRCDNDMCLDLSGDRTFAVLFFNRVSCAVSNGLQGLWVTSLDLIAQWSTLTVSNCRVYGTWSVAL